MLTIHIASALLLRPDGALLLVRKRGTTRFMLAGGKIATGESPLQTVVRELQEELGLQLSATDFTPLGLFNAPAANEPGHTVHAELFVADIDCEVHAAAEIEEVIWMQPDQELTVPLAYLAQHTAIPAWRSILGERRKIA